MHHQLRLLTTLSHSIYFYFTDVFLTLILLLLLSGDIGILSTQRTTAVFCGPVPVESKTITGMIDSRLNNF
jgi:hypothetical protein